MELRRSLLWFLLQHYILLILIQLLYNQLPAVPDPVKGQFFAPNAFGHAGNLTSLGPRVTGSEENEVLAVQVLMSKLESMKKESRWKIKISHQVGNGAFHWNRGDGVTMKYSGVQNVVARLSYSNGSPKNSQAILINCHFDTVPLSPGASDDAISCGMMLEVLGCLSERDHKLHQDVIFLFNGAEEAALAGSHLFITQHPWAKDVVLFINLEAAGAGGREMLFQFGPRNVWILDKYMDSVPHPSMSVMAQEAFESGYIPSDTDFRIFRDFGNLSGFDIAYVQNGYVYHTMYDTLDRIPLGSVQRAGENLLALTTSLANMTHFPEEEEGGQRSPVYFELLGFMAFSYGEANAKLFNGVVCLASLMYICAKLKAMHRETDAGFVNLIATLVILCVIRAASFVLSLIYVSIMAMLLERQNLTMSWYSNLHILLVLYALPTLYTMIWMYDCAKKRYSAQYPHLKTLTFEGVQLELMLYTSIGTFCGVRSTYLPALFIIFPLLGKFAEDQVGEKLENIINPLHVFPLLNSFYVAFLFITFFVPIMGRRGSNFNPDIIIGCLTVFLTHFSMIYNMDKLARSRDISRTRQILKIIFFTAMFLIIASPRAFPYMNDRQMISPQPLNDGQMISPQRLFVHHTRRTRISASGAIIDQDGGVFIEKMDFYEPRALAKLIPGFQTAQSFYDCRNADSINCGLPFYLGNPSQSKRRYWLSNFQVPNIDEADQVALSLVEKIEIGDELRLMFKLKGPSAMKMILSLEESLELTNWSLTDIVRPGKLSWSGKKTYQIHFVRGLIANDMNNCHEFWLQLKKPGIVEGKLSKGVLDFAISGAIYSREAIDPRFKEFLNHFPTWTFPWAWTVDFRLQQFIL